MQDNPEPPPATCVEPPQISVVIPFYNEEENVEPVMEEVIAVLCGMGRTFEILAVDDGSSDDTVIRLRRMRASHREVRLLRMRRNSGQTAAMQAGFQACRGSVVISMDGDGQNDPSAIPLLIERLEVGHDLVCGWRHRRQDRLVTRKIPSWIANRLIGRLTGVPIHDNGCSLKAYDARLLRRLRLYSDQHRFIPALSSLAGARIDEVKVPHRARMAGESKYGLSRTYKVLLDVMTLVMLRSALNRPARAFMIPGLLLGLAGILSLLAGVASTLETGASLVVLGGAGFLLLFAAGHFVILGLLAELARNKAGSLARPGRRMA
ncbi:MAG: glycosyltransferase family 2 protein [Acidobacteria bacterium]|nr:glycosyltransferase family 2 protein [Acidobacteriota bacterium]